MCNRIKFIPIVVLFVLIASCNTKLPDGHYDYSASAYKSIADSFYTRLYRKQWCLAYDELDLSVKPLKQPVFRLVYETAFGEAAVFIVNKNELIIKQPLMGNPYRTYDSLKLSGMERLHFRVLKRNFPIQEMDSQNRRKPVVDSLAKIYPKLLDPNYYSYLLDKSFKPDSIPFKYSVKKVALSESKYNEIVNQINSSGYWELPRHVECDYDYTDGYGIILEANTPKKYKIVSIGICSEKALKFSKACQAIINVANLDKKIIIVSDN